MRLVSLLLALVLTACTPGCVSTAQPVKASQATMQHVRSATVWVSVESAIGRGGGTGWVLTDGMVPLIVTAGHVCDYPGAKFGLRDRDGKTADAVLLRHINDEADDVCVLAAIGYRPLAKLTLASDEDLSFGDPVAYVGFPAGVTAMFHGHVVATTESGYLQVSMPGWYGASGSAVVDAGGNVVGLLSALNVQFPSTLYIVPVKRIRWLLEAIRG